MLGFAHERWILIVVIDPISQARANTTALDCRDIKLMLPDLEA